MLAISTILTVLLYTPVMRLLSGANVTKPNYRKRYVVGAFGILLPMVMLTSAGLFALTRFAQTGSFVPSEGLLLLLVLVSGLGFIGFVDDILGSRLIGGLRGHFSQLRHGVVTTGTLKAVIGLALSALAAAALADNIFSFLVGLGVLALSINAANLFDLRPGRAIKVFALAAIGLLIAGWANQFFWALWGLIIPPVAGLLFGDLKEQSMMGDSGSNVLGAIIGLTFVINLTLIPLVAVLAALIALHAVAEKYSIGRFIERMPLLKQFDALGLKK
jgi:UDP-GlcNAc:undecaprenyl-phosphate/decaprenyl-phosphate GlcNAc-1-phosphate transferase